jgi:glucose-1-phosphate adenylyltransferase
MELLLSDSAESVLILSGDHIYHMDYRELLKSHAERNADLTIATVEHPLEDASHFGVVEVNTDFRVTGFEEKPLNPRPMPSRPSMALVSMGVYVFRRSALLESLVAHCRDGSGFDFGKHIVPSLIHAARAYAYDFRDEENNSPRYWRDIGTLDGYYETSMDLVRPGAPFDPYTNAGWPSQPTQHPDLSDRGQTCLSLRARLHRRCHVSGSVVSPGVEIEEGASVEDSIVMPGVRVAKGARLRRTIVEEGVNIPAGYRVGFDSGYDREHHLLTDRGVVVVSQTPAEVKSAILRLLPRCSLAGAIRPVRSPIK